MEAVAFARVGWCGSRPPSSATPPPSKTSNSVPPGLDAQLVAPPRVAQMRPLQFASENRRANPAWGRALVQVRAFRSSRRPGRSIRRSSSLSELRHCDASRHVPQSNPPQLPMGRPARSWPLHGATKVGKMCWPVETSRTLVVGVGASRRTCSPALDNPPGKTSRTDHRKPSEVIAYDPAFVARIARNSSICAGR